MLLKQHKPTIKLADEPSHTDAVQDIAPREATVFFQMGRIYKKLGKVEAAMEHFNSALDLKPCSTDQHLIKSAIEKLHVDDDEVDDEI